MNDSNIYFLSTEDLSAWPVLINLQSVTGEGTPDMDNAGTTALAQWIASMSQNNMYQSSGAILNTISNEQLISWITAVFGNLCSFSTNYNNRKLPELYTAYTFFNFIQAYGFSYCMSPGEYFSTFENGLYPDRRKWDDCLVGRIDPWNRAATPDSWKNGINHVFSTWNNKVPDDLNLGPALIQTAHWTNAQDLKGALLPLWTSQAAALGSLQGAALDDDGCLFLFCLLGSSVPAVPHYSSMQTK